LISLKHKKKTTCFNSAILVFAKGELFGGVRPSQTIALVQEDLFPHAKRLGANTA